MSKLFLLKGNFPDKNDHDVMLSIPLIEFFFMRKIEEVFQLVVVTSASKIIISFYSEASLRTTAKSLVEAMGSNPADVDSMHITEMGN
jgi:hypothetical protein